LFAGASFALHPLAERVDDHAFAIVGTGEPLMRV
jgi:hypothetical protein